MTSPTQTTHDTAHQTPGADATAIKEHDRITILNKTVEFAILVGTAKPSPRGEGAVYVHGRELNGRGKPYARSGHGLDVSGPAGGTWDWWRFRKPNRDPITGRRRLIRANGDGEAIYRAARRYDASVSIAVAPDTSTPVDLFEHPRVALTVKPDGSWEVAQRAAGPRADYVVVATGHIDQVPAPTPPNTAS
ncbi:hypothetical protein KBX50_08345 [Micromonospora sp. C51]|uniref:hypothetical protein n=1 Tax=Micromonospora sp. C51 TaxID=2824879 RepID=UPI001B382042|nr:hypothetical protein [Micromonospora sp. C51]MBQ1048473.1 hypothetical protein [Micromonospora sp. C51]